MKNKLSIQSELFICFLFLLFSTLGSADEINFEKALNAFQNEDFEKSESYFELLVEKDPSKPIYWFNLGNSRLKLDDPDAAIPAYEKTISLKSPLAAAASVYLVRCYRLTQNYKKAIRLINSLEIRSQKLPENLARFYANEKNELYLDLLEDAFSAYDKENYNEALELANFTIQMKKTSNSYLILALILWKKENYNAAKNALNQGLQYPDENTSHANIKNLLTKLEEGKLYNENRFWLELDIAAGYNSNIFAVGQTANPVGKGTLQFNPNAGIRLIQGKPISFNIGYSLYGEKYRDTTSLDFFSHSFFAPVKMQKYNWVTELTPTFKYQTLNKIHFLTRYGGKLLVQKNLKKNRIGASYEYAKNNAGDVSYSYLNGSVHMAKIFWSFVGPNYRFKLGYTEALNASNDIVTNFATLPLKNNTRGPTADYFIAISDKWDIDGGLWFYWINYSNKAQPENFLRNDTQFDVNIKLTRRITERFSVYLTNEYLINNSNLGETNSTNKNYSQYVGLFGLNWEIL